MEVTVDWLRERFKADGYICGDDVIIPTYLALRLNRPLLVEGEPGVGKTEIGKVLARVFDTELIRLQCYEGLDETKALYEWNYQRQLLRIQLNRDADPVHDMERDLFSEEYLLERPLLRALRSEQTPVLLIDEVDKCDEEFEAFLFEVLSDFQVSIPELGTIRAKQIPIVVLTSNRARELSDGLKRRCLFLYVDFPDVSREVEIIKARVPEVEPALAAQIARAIGYIRTLDVKKRPSIAETLDWARSLLNLGAHRLTPELISQTASVVVKSRDDLRVIGEGKTCVDIVTRAAEGTDDDS